jgi:glyoxylase-like metal-dependent hydrolase (beta-lactamase superfamily II)
MSHSELLVEPVVQELRVPAGIAGPADLTFDVRCFLVAHPAGLVLIDTGPAGSADAIGAALDRVRADRDDVTDIVLSHLHPDHVGGLDEVASGAHGN